jgi:hypothetical protein
LSSQDKGAQAPESRLGRNALTRCPGFRFAASGLLESFAIPYLERQ